MLIISHALRHHITSPRDATRLAATVKYYATLQVCASFFPSTFILLQHFILFYVCGL